jgi:hypothetical protein
MFIHPSIHLEIAHERQRDLLATSERRRTVKAAGRQARLLRRAPVSSCGPSGALGNDERLSRPQRANA